MLRCYARFAGLLVAAFAFSALTAQAQTTFGRISGTITDPSSAPISGVRVTVRNVDTQATRALLTDGRGFYVAENLPIGPYQVEADHPGFKVRGCLQLCELRGSGNEHFR